MQYEQRTIGDFDYVLFFDRWWWVSCFNTRQQIIVEEFVFQTHIEAYAHWQHNVATTIHQGVTMAECLPIIGDSVHVEARMSERDTNGEIIYIDYDTEEIIVKFHNSKETGDYSLDAFTGNWTDKFNGVWLI